MISQIDQTMFQRKNIKISLERCFSKKIVNLKNRKNWFEIEILETRFIKYLLLNGDSWQCKHYHLFILSRRLPTLYYV